MSQADVAGWSAREPSLSRFPRSARYLVATLIVVAGIVALWLTLHWQATPQVQQLPERERLELFRRTLDDLRLCATKSGALIPAHCEHQAELVQDFAECDHACRDLALSWDHRPTR
jgi:hypothetical protein